MNSLSREEAMGRFGECIFMEITGTAGYLLDACFNRVPGVPDRQMLRSAV